jgi:hypothetical protein
VDRGFAATAAEWLSSEIADRKGATPQPPDLVSGTA